MNKRQFLIVDLKPHDTPGYMIPAWLDCISWAIDDPDTLAQFKVETGMSWTPAKVWGPIDGTEAGNG